VLPLWRNILLPPALVLVCIFDVVLRFVKAYDVLPFNYGWFTLRLKDGVRFKKPGIRCAVIRTKQALVRHGGGKVERRRLHQRRFFATQFFRFSVRSLQKTKISLLVLKN
jgi:hypothetical protein